MYFKFATDDLKHARAALLLYGLYRSRDKNSPLNGMETWDRFGSFVRGACLKGSTTAEFVQAFCKKAKIGSIKPKYFNTGDPVVMPDTGEIIVSDKVSDYRLDILSDNTLLDILNNETMYLIMLVRERIQREKMTYAEDEYDETED